MKHIKKHPINDKDQKLSKDMKKQDLVKPKKDKELDADDSLSDPKISKKYTKPSNRKLDGENFLSKDAGKIKKTNEEIYFRGGSPVGKFYWLSDKNPTAGSSAITIGKYNEKHNDGSGDPFWELIGSDEVFKDDYIRQHFEVMNEIPYESY